MMAVTRSTLAHRLAVVLSNGEFTLIVPAAANALIAKTT